MADLMELDLDDLQIIKSALVGKLEGFPLDRDEDQRVEIMAIGYILRAVDKAMDVAEEEKRLFNVGASQYHFENMKEGRI